MASYSKKWHNGTSRTRSTETSDGLAAIQAQLNNLGREIKKVNEKVYAAQVGCEKCKGPHYTKDCPLKEEGKTLEEAYYTQFGGPFQGGGYKAAAPGFYQRNNTNPSRLNGYYCEGKKGSYGPQFLEAYSEASHINNSIPRKEKDPGKQDDELDAEIDDYPNYCNYDKKIHIDYQNGVIERQNRTLIEASRTMLIYAKAPLFLWAEAVATACYTQNRSIIRLRHGKTPYELLHDKLPDLSFFHVFGALCYPTNDSENLGKLQPKADIGIFIGTRAKPFSSTPFVPPSRTDWDLLFQLLFDELLNPPSSVDRPAPEVIALIVKVVAPEPAASIGSPSSTTVDQDAPSPIEPKNYKDALTQACWIEAMQEELNEFERLKVWELVPRPDKVMVITLKWIYKVKLDEMGGILTNKARLPSRRETYLSDPMDTPMVEKSKLDEDTQGKAVDPTHYRRTIGTLMYPTASRPDLTFDYQLADIFTKALCKERIEFLINKLGMRSFTPETLKQLADEAEE
ncbi:retrovirus-related pol polyprotein from transposon TNT 1-94 [Tanacetum coccineum]